MNIHSVLERLDQTREKGLDAANSAARRLHNDTGNAWLEVRDGRGSHRGVIIANLDDERGSVRVGINNYAEGMNRDPRAEVVINGETAASFDVQSDGSLKLAASYDPEKQDTLANRQLVSQAFAIADESVTNLEHELGITAPEAGDQSHSIN